MTWKNGLIALYTPTRDGLGIFGTAFPVGPDLALTARHVVRPEGTLSDTGGLRDPSKGIKIRWWYSAEKKGFTDAPPDSEFIVWEDGDIALLRVERPVDRSETCFLLKSKPTTGKIWESEGFPRAAKSSDLRQPSSFSGTCMSKADAEEFFECNVTSFPSQEAEWGGASGMPIVVEGYVIGVAVQVPNGFGGKKLQIAPIWKAWDKGLHEQLPGQKHLEKIRQEVDAAIGRFENNPDIRQAFSTNFDLDRSSGNWRQEAVEVVLSVFEPQETFERLIRAMQDRDPDTEHCSDLFEFARVIGPLLLRQRDSAIEWLSQQRGTGQAILGQVPIAHHSMAELVVAAAHDRAAEFLQRRSEDDEPFGRHLVPLQPVCTGETVEVQVIEAFAKMYPDLVDGSGGQNNGKLPPVDMLENLIRYNKVLSAAELSLKLAQLRRVRRPQPYLAFELPPEGEGRDRIVREVTELCSKVPELLVIALDPSRRDSQMEIVWAFRMLIPMGRTDRGSLHGG